MNKLIVIITALLLLGACVPTNYHEAYHYDRDGNPAGKTVIYDHANYHYDEDLNYLGVTYK